jgi:hypothetical protein
VWYLYGKRYEEHFSMDYWKSGAYECYSSTEEGRERELKDLLENGKGSGTKRTAPNKTVYAPGLRPSGVPVC